jgi:HEAT repeat protein
VIGILLIINEEAGVNSMKHLSIKATVLACFLLVAIAAQAAEDGNITSLIANLGSSHNFKVRLQSAILLGRAGDKRAVDPLIACLRDSDYAIRGAAAIALGNIGDPSAVPALLGLLKDGEALVRKEAGNALVKLAVNPSVTKDILAAFKGSDLKLKAGISYVLGNLKSDEALAALGDALGDDVGDISDTVAQVILGLEPEKSVKVLIKTVQGRDPKARLRAMRLMMQVKNAQFVEPLAQVLGTDAPGEEAKTAREALRSMRQYISSYKFVALAKSGEMAERDRAIQILGISGDEAAIRALMDLLSDDNVYFRGRAAQSLALAGDKRAVPKLEKMLKDKSNQRIADIIRNSIKILQHNN